MVSSTVPRLDERWPPVFDTDSSTKARSSSASCCSWRRSSERSCAGSSIFFSSSYIAGSYGLAAAPLAGRLPVRVAMNLEFSQNHEVRERRKAPGARAEAFERGLGVGPQFLGELPRAASAQERNVGGFPLPGILAGGLAERGGACLGVQKIVDHLEGEGPRLGVAGQAGPPGFRQRPAPSPAPQP